MVSSTATNKTLENTSSTAYRRLPFPTTLMFSFFISLSVYQRYYSSVASYTFAPLITRKSTHHCPLSTSADEVF